MPHNQIFIEMREKGVNETESATDLLLSDFIRHQSCKTPVETIVFP